MHTLSLHHAPHHGALAALVAAALCLGMSDAQGQSPAAAAAAEGRPAMAGAQGGLGAQPGLAQGGLGVQGTAGAQVEIPLKRPGRSSNPTPPQPAADSTVVQNAIDNPLGSPDVRPGRPSEVKPAQSAPRKASRAAKRSMERARHGVGQIDAQGGVKN